MSHKFDLNAKLWALTAVFCLLAACGKSQDDSTNQPGRVKTFASAEDEFFETGAGRMPIRLRLEQDGQGQTLFAIYRLPKKGQAADNQTTFQLKLCTIGSDQELQMAKSLMQEIKDRSGYAGIVRADMSKADLGVAHGSYLVTPVLPPGFDLEKLTKGQRNQLSATAYIVSWPGEGSLRSCQYSLETARPNVPKQGARVSRGSKVSPPQKDNSKADWFGN